MSTNKKTMSIEEKIFQLAESKPFDKIESWEKADKYSDIIADILEMMKISDSDDGNWAFLIFRNVDVEKRIKFKYLKFGYIGTVFIVYFDEKPFVYQFKHMTKERTISTESFLCHKNVFMKMYDFLYKQMRKVVKDDVLLYADNYEIKRDNLYEPTDQQLKIVGDELHIINTDDNTFVVCS